MRTMSHPQLLSVSKGLLGGWWVVAVLPIQPSSHNPTIHARRAGRATEDKKLIN